MRFSRSQAIGCSCWSVTALWFGLAALPLAAGELTVEDFTFEGPLGSKGATVEKVGPEHFRVKLDRAPGHPEWANMLQFTILRNAKGKRLRLDGGGPGMRRFCSWSYDGEHWQPIRLTTVQAKGQPVQTLLFPEFTEDRVLVGVEVPMSYEDLVQMMEKWGNHPHAKVHVIGKSLEGRNILRLTITDPDSPHPPATRWGHHCVNQHPSEYNSHWRMAGMVEWLLSDQGDDCRQRQIWHFVIMLNPDGPANGWIRTNAQGIDMNRSYSADGSNREKQAHESYVVQKDLEGLMASDTPVTTTWSMHTWAGIMEPRLYPGPEMEASLGPWTDLREIIRRHDTRGLIKPLAPCVDRSPLTLWSLGSHTQFGMTAFCCEGSADIETKEENLYTGQVLARSMAEYYRGIKPAPSSHNGRR